MKNQSIKDILPLIEKPSRYLGNEKNSVKKDIESISLHIALAFPDLYEIGMSHFGLQILYHILNEQVHVAAERVYAPGSDLAAYIKSAGISLSSLETGTPLSGFDIIGFSLLYEMNYTNVLMMLDLAGIPFYASDRDVSHPIIIAGGPCTVNPEPVADFFDAMVIGDGESVVVEMARTWMAWKNSGGRDKISLLKDWAKIEGVYIPSFFQPVYDGPDFKEIQPKFNDYQRVRRAIVADLNQAKFPDSPVVAYGRPIHDRLRLEVARGCTRGCRFCQAGMIYRPVRERSVENLMDLTVKSIAATGYDDISLLSLSTGDYGCLSTLMQGLFHCYSSENIALSFPSFRAGTLSPEIMSLVKQVRKTGFTIAPEAGSEHLRAVINKNISEQEVFDTVSSAFELGWKLIKFYFMIGLPTETEEDRYAIVDLVKRIRQKLKSEGHRPNINVSIGTFIPKPHVPFQWSLQISLAESKEIIFDLKRQLKMPGVEFKWQKPELSLLEGLWARGDRRLSRLLEIAYCKGCCFDGWSDRFDYPLWEAAIHEAGIDINYYTTRLRSADEPLPWDHIDTGISKEFLISEYENALTGTPLSDCRFGDCQGCGVCDFDKIKPVYVAPNFTPDFTLDKTFASFSGGGAGSGVRHPLPSQEMRIEIFYSKTGPAKFFGHLEMVNIFTRAIRRAGMKIKFTQGFHPKPKISFHNPLPVGMESEEESFYITLRESADCEEIVLSVNNQLPEGLLVTGCRNIPANKRPKLSERAVYRVTVIEEEFEDQKITAFNDASEWIVIRTTKKGRKKQINLKDIILSIQLLGPTKLRIQLKMMEGLSVRPADVIRSVFQLSDEVILRAEIIKEKQKDTLVC
ncbi:MAG: TIGR03960 family B12-binding radical SAM protein [Desulfobacteraceae bacterium]|nr:TIGR03960 family B12-binding radical SAM protein [Desulfobacteraceae bacterium]MBC2757045.1 TIGR03960 family B12-binding radical SAM protein [Desulfobacteraceae bacterium]